MKVQKMRGKIQQFMRGRYGFDELSRMYLIMTIVLMILSMFVGNRWIYLLGLVLLVYCYYRALSKNLEKRRQENQKFCNIRYQSAVKRSAWKQHQEQKKIYRFYKCPQCRQKVRVPKGKGKICITCPKCRTEFIKKS